MWENEKSMIPYQTKTKKIPGTSLSEVRKHVNFLLNQIEKKTKRKPYILAAYFKNKSKKEKIFFDFFEKHLRQKGPKERFERLKYFEAAIEVVKNSRNKPGIRTNPNNKNEIFYRFAGLTKNKELFFVQIKENVRSKNKYFMSCFSPE